MLQIYDRVLGSGSQETLAALFILMTCLFALYGGLEYARGRVMARVGSRFQSDMNAQAFRAVIKRATLGGAAKSSADPLQSLEAIAAFLGSPVLLSLFDVLWVPAFLAVIFVFHPDLGWLAFIGGAILIIVALLNQIITRTKALETIRFSTSAAQFSRSCEAGSDYLWAQGMTGTMARRWCDLHNQVATFSAGASDWTSAFSSFSKAFRFFLQSSMLALGAWLVLKNELTAGAMIAASILLGRALAPVEQVINMWPVVQRAQSGWRDLQECLGAVENKGKKTDLPAPKAELSVNNITVVTQPDSPPILRGVGFRLSPGQALGIIGKSGSGKTTLARVLAGIVCPNGGEVRIGGATLDQYVPENLGKHLGYLPQDVVFFNGTIAENIAQMSLNPDAEKVVAAANMAHVHDVILGLENGYDTYLIPPFLPLSGGQKQRLALARALFGSPAILVLDEPNSALDAEGSEALNAVILDMKAAGKAIVIMTHRPLAISNCDHLLILERGRVAASGPRDEIIKSMLRNAGDVHHIVHGA